MDDRSYSDAPHAFPAADSDLDIQLNWNPFITRSARNFARTVKDRALEANDLAQIGRIRVFRLGAAATAQPRNWIGKVIANEMRRAAGQPASPPPLCKDALAVPDGQTESEATLLVRMSVRRWIQGLPPILQAVYQLLYVEQVSQRAAADALHCSQSRVSQLHTELLDRGRTELTSVAA